jgi:antibiotic biosynthesis monooxygenase (ABM) superfamily enzyme
MSQPIERIILVNLKEGVSAEQFNAIAQHGREVLGAIPGVEIVSLGIALNQGASHRYLVRLRFHDLEALKIYESHPNHTTYGLQEWLPIITDEILNDYTIAY